MTKALTPKQKRFVDAYDGDIRRSAEKAGLSYTYCRQLMTYKKHSHVQKAVKSRERTESHRRILTRQQRQEFWSEVVGMADERMADRLKASELLGRSNADFTDNINARGTVGLYGKTLEELDEILAELREKVKK